MIVPWTQEWAEPVRALLRTCLGPQTLQLDEKLWHWQYAENPAAAGVVPVALFADAPEALGVLGRIPVRLSTPQGELDAAWGVDVMVHPEFHNAGIGGLLIEDWDACTPVSLSLGVTDMALAVFLSSGRTHVKLRKVMNDVLACEPLARPQYVSCADPLSLQELDGVVDHGLLSMAVFIGKTRLIDNVLLS